MARDKPIRLQNLPEVQIRRHAKTRRLRLKFDPTSGAFWVVAHPLTPRARIREFVEEARRFIADKSQRARPERIAFDPGARIPVLGIEREIAPVSGIAVPRLTDTRLEIPAETPDPRARVATFLRALARERLDARCRAHVAALKPRIPYRKLRIGDQRSRWGSASGRGTLSFNWRIVMAPEFVLDYLAAHEVTHLQDMDHSAKFWATCRQLAPRTREAETWLNTQGKQLRLYGPDPAS